MIRWDDLIESEWKEYIDLVDSFSTAKLNKDYNKSDEIRDNLFQWQELSEHEFIQMHISKVYMFNRMFESKGPNGNRKKRLQKRENMYGTIC